MYGPPEPRENSSTSIDGTVYYYALASDQQVHYYATTGINVGPVGKAFATDTGTGNYGEYTILPAAS